MRVADLDCSGFIHIGRDLTQKHQEFRQEQPVLDESVLHQIEETVTDQTGTNLPFDCEFESLSEYRY